MTTVISCDRTECACNDGGECVNFYGIEIDSFGECQSFEESEETDVQSND